MLFVHFRRFSMAHIISSVTGCCIDWLKDAWSLSALTIEMSIGPHVNDVGRRTHCTRWRPRVTRCPKKFLQRRWTTYIEKIIWQWKRGHDFEQSNAPICRSTWQILALKLATPQKNPRAITRSFNYSRKQYCSCRCLAGSNLQSQGGKYI